MSNPKYRGVVRWFSNTKGYGFIEPIPESKGDIIVHHKEVRKDWEGEYVSLAEGQRVEFSLIQTDKGARAVEVVRV